MTTEFLDNCRKVETVIKRYINASPLRACYASWARMADDADLPVITVRRCAAYLCVSKGYQSVKRGPRHHWIIEASDRFDDVDNTADAYLRNGASGLPVGHTFNLAPTATDAVSYPMRYLQSVSDPRGMFHAQRGNQAGHAVCNSRCVGMAEGVLRNGVYMCRRCARIVADASKRAEGWEVGYWRLNGHTGRFKREWRW